MAAGMIVGQLLLWARTAGAGERAEAARALAQAYLYSDLTAEDRWEAESAITAFLDDPSPLVRYAIAESLADSSEAPRHVVVALASDQSEIAAVVLSRSPVLTAADLVDCAALGGPPVQTAIACRPAVPAGVSAALGEIAASAALAALARNRGAAITDTTLARMVARHGDCAELREALLTRPDLPAPIRQAIAVALSQSLSSFVLDCGWLSPERTERVAREARERTTLALGRNGDRADVAGLVEHLRRTGQLTPALILRAILSRARDFAEAAFAELSGLPVRRAAGILWDRRGSGFSALYRKAGLPASLKPAFDAALGALREMPGDDFAAGAQLSRQMVERVLSACESLPAEDAGRLMALLRRYESEAAREEARELADGLVAEAVRSAALQLRYMPPVVDGYAEDARDAA
jgi:uncharacterized protein (DUF2336 family)